MYSIQSWNCQSFSTLFTIDLVLKVNIIYAHDRFFFSLNLSVLTHMYVNVDKKDNEAN